MKQKPNGSRLEETTALLQQAMATLLQNQVLFEARMDRMTERMEQKFAEIDRRFDAVIRRLERLEALILREFAALPQRIFNYSRAAKQQVGPLTPC
jgi:hypothetical protein